MSIAAVSQNVMIRPAAPPQTSKQSAQVDPDHDGDVDAIPRAKTALPAGQGKIVDLTA